MLEFIACGAFTYFPLSNQMRPNIDKTAICWQVETDGEHFLRDLRKDLQKSLGFDAVMRVRTSTGEEKQTMAYCCYSSPAEFYMMLCV